jgi:hypothetical protein
MESTQLQPVQHFGICECCYAVKLDCVYVWMSPDGREGCTHPGAPIKACGDCRERRAGRFAVAEGK